MTGIALRKRFWLSLALLLMVSGCAPKLQERVFWPPPPNDPRLEWLNVYHSEADFPKNKGQKALRTFVGEDGTFLFKKPIGIVANGRGQVYVSDNILDDVKIFDMNNATVKSLTNDRVFEDPIGMTIDSEGKLYIADAARRSVLVFSSENKPMFNIGSEKTLEKPVYVAVNDKLQRVYVTDAKAHRVAVFNTAGEHLFNFGQHGNGNGYFYAPQGIAIDKDGRVFVADMFNFRIQVFDSEGKFLYAFGEQGDGPSNFELPKDLSFDSEGNLWIVDTRKAAILTYSQDGKFLLFTGMGRTNHALGFSMPSSIHVDRNDRIYVVDQMLRRFTEWQYLSQEFLKANPIDNRILDQQKEKLQQLQKRN